MLALHALVTRNDIIDRKDPHMTHMQLPAGIREHRQTIKFLFVRILTNLEAPLGLPILTSFFLDHIRIVSNVHQQILRSISQLSKAERIP